MLTLIGVCQKGNSFRITAFGGLLGLRHVLGEDSRERAGAAQQKTNQRAMHFDAPMGVYLPTLEQTGYIQRVPKDVYTF